MDYAIEIEGLSKIYPQPRSFFEVFKKSAGKPILALDGIDLKVKNRDFFGVLGPNGAGKTTLTKILCTLIIPTEGSVRVNGFDLLKSGEKIRSTVGLVSSEERSFYWKLTGRQNLMFFALLHDLKRDRAGERVKQVLKEVGLWDRADSRFETYSSGMKQKMSIARGLLNDPEILFMDEPTRSLDPNAARDVRSFISEKSEEGKTVFLTTHNLHEAEELCSRVAILHKGRVKGLGSVRDLGKMVKQTEKITLTLGGISEEKIYSLKKLEGVQKIESRRGHDSLYHVEIEASEGFVSEIITALLRSGGKIMSVHTHKVGLEEIFEELTIEGG